MTFRDDRDALFARLEAVLHDNAVLQRQNAELRSARSPEPMPLPGGIVACMACGRANDFRKSCCAYCGALRDNDSFTSTLRGHAPAWPAITRPASPRSIMFASTHGPTPARTPSRAWTVVQGLLLAASILGAFLATKLLLLDGVG
jgi:hypothetical protein